MTTDNAVGKPTIRLTVEEIKDRKNRILKKQEFVKKQLEAVPDAIADLEASRNIEKYIEVRPDYTDKKLDFIRKERIKRFISDGKIYQKQLDGYSARIEALNKRLEFLNKPKGITIANNTDLAKRFSHFRVKYIDKDQTTASEKLGIAQSTLSIIESGKRKVSFTLTQKLINEYNLNAEWLATGKGLERLDGKTADTARASLQNLYIEVQSIKKGIAMMEANMNHFIKVIERMEVRMEKAEDAIRGEKHWK